MSDTKVARLDGVLTELITAACGIDAAAVVSFDGLMMAHVSRGGALPDDLDEDRVAAMSAALLSLGEQATKGFGCGNLDQLFAEGDDGYVVMLSARDEAVLTAVADRDAKLGFILYEMRRAADRIADVLLDRGRPQEAPAPLAIAPSPLTPPRIPVVADDPVPLPSRPLFATGDGPAALFAGAQLSRDHVPVGSR